jgi:two-component SAPR family response regulator
MTYEKQLPRQELRRLQRQDEKLDKKIMYSERELRDKFAKIFEEKYTIMTDKIELQERERIEHKLRKEFGWGDKRVSRLFGGGL